MEKLIELLNEYLFEKGEKLVMKNYYNNDWTKDVGGEFKGVNLKDTKYGIGFIRGEQVIGKRYGFIKWLVDNDKINISNYEYEIGVARIGENNMDEWRDEYSDYEKTLMLLAIQDEPIEFLCSILK